jgi:hypothetical protein
MSSLLICAPAGGGSASPLPPNKPIRSSMFDCFWAGAWVAGDATRCGVPARPSRPDSPWIGAFCIDAGAEPSKSISRRFSKLLVGATFPLTAAAAAAAAIGFSLASSSCSSIAACCIASAPNRPCPRNASGGLWYTEARVDSSVRSVSSSCGGNDRMVVVMGGLSDSTMSY